MMNTCLGIDTTIHSNSQMKVECFSGVLNFKTSKEEGIHVVIYVLLGFAYCRRNG